MYAVIMAGGSGTRFWPLSRERLPKQLLRLFGDKTMVEETISRVTPLIPEERIYILTTSTGVESIRFHLPHLERRLGRNFIVEPAGKNTAPALGLAAIHLKGKDPEGIMVALPADHVIRDGEVFLETLRVGKTVAGEGYLVTIGIRPTRPETGYGYIALKDRVDEERGIVPYRVERFVEKPDLPRAKRFLRSGRYLWNSGIFIWKVSTFLEEMERHMPDLYGALLRIEEALRRGDQEEADRIYLGLAPISVDYGIMERSHRIKALPGLFEWNDVGSWRAMEDLLARDEKGNVVVGNVMAIESRDSILYGGERLLAVLGVEGMVVVDTEDATLVCPKERAQDVRRVVEALKREGSEHCLTHRTVQGPWGLCCTLVQEADLVVRRVTVNPGATFKVDRTGELILLQGRARLRKDGGGLEIGTKGTPSLLGKVREVENPSDEPLHLLEIEYPRKGVLP